jgi:hypothetical protein
VDWRTHRRESFVCVVSTECFGNPAWRCRTGTETAGASEHIAILHPEEQAERLVAAFLQTGALPRAQTDAAHLGIAAAALG